MDGRVVHGKRLRALREQAGLHRRELAAAIGCSVGHLKNVEIETGRNPHNPTSTGDQLSGVLVHRAVRVLTAHLGRAVDIAEFTTPTSPSDAEAAA